MNCEESIKWLDSLIKTLGQSQYQSLWNWEQPLTEIKEMLESKRVMELPCKVGTMVFEIRSCFDCKTDSFICCHNFSYRGEKACRHCENNIKKNFVSIAYFNFKMKDKFGKTVFLTKSEAEQKLKELQNK